MKMYVYSLIAVVAFTGSLCSAVLETKTNKTKASEIPSKPLEKEYTSFGDFFEDDTAYDIATERG